MDGVKRAESLMVMSISMAAQPLRPRREITKHFQLNFKENFPAQFGVKSTVAGCAVLGLVWFSALIT
jgi:hypothetical protein